MGNDMRKDEGMPVRCYKVTDQNTGEWLMTAPLSTIVAAYGLYGEMAAKVERNDGTAVLVQGVMKGGGGIVLVRVMPWDPCG